MTQSTEQFADRFFNSALAAIDIFAIHIGDRLGYYTALADGEHTSAQLAEATATDPRYTREWLEQQATSGLLEVNTNAPEPTFTLPESHRPVLTDVTDSNYLAPLARMLVTAGEKMTPLLDAYRNGGGVGWDSYGPGMRESQADMNRPFFLNELAGIFSGLERAHDLLSTPGAHAADVGCGVGWSTIALAHAYPGLTLHGYDIDAPAIESARQNAKDAGVADRVTFTAINIGDEPPAAAYDVTMAFEAIHDMPQPVEVLTAMRTMLKDGGTSIVMDEAVGDTFTGTGGDVERLMYGFSLLVCLPDGRSTEPSVGTGTVMRPAVLSGYARDAGFSDSTAVAEAGFFRFYELTP